jgi:aminoglycoside phosphotransferase (APT) family kinase protein
VRLTSQRHDATLRVGLERWLGHTIRELDRPEPGWSCETLIVDRELVIRLPPADDGIFPDYNLAQQAAVQSAVGSSGVPVASPVEYEPDPSYLGAPFLAMPFVDGPIPSELTAPDVWLRSLTDDSSRRAVWSSFLDTITRIHDTPTEGLGLRKGLDAELDFWNTYLPWATGGEAPRQLVDALSWCRSNRPVAEPADGLLWGDVRLGNVVFDSERLVPKAVLDWDMASAGPIEMDLAWFLALDALQSDLMDSTVPGFGDHADAVSLVEERIRRTLVDVNWHEIFALVRASCVSTRIALLLDRAGRRSIFKIGQDPALCAAVQRIEAA